MSVQNVYKWQEERLAAYKIRKYDRFYISRDFYKKFKLGGYVPNTPLMCIELIRRDKWWQFWKTRYKGAIYQAMEAL